MGYPKDYGPRKCPHCLHYYPVKTMTKLGARYYCAKGAALVRRLMLRRVGPNGNGGLR